MSSLSDGGAAFPRPFSEDKLNEESLPSQKGMSLRDYFAAKAMTSVISLVGLPIEDIDSLWNEDLAKQCYSIADAMLKQREKQNG